MSCQSAAASYTLFSHVLCGIEAGGAAALCQGRASRPADFQAGIGELHQAKTDLVTAIRQFAEAAAGPYGDEGRLLLPALDALERTLDPWNRAIAVYQSAARAAPENADIHAALGSVYLDRSRTREASIEFAASARLDPRRADVHELSATAYGIVGDSPNAVAELQKAAALEPRDLATLYRLATALASAASPAASGVERRFDAEHLSTPDGVPLQFDRVALMRQAGADDPLAASAPTAAAAGARLRQRQLQAALSGLRSAIDDTPEAGDAAEIHRVAADAHLALGGQDAHTREETRFVSLSSRKRKNGSGRGRCCGSDDESIHLAIQRFGNLVSPNRQITK